MSDAKDYMIVLDENGEPRSVNLHTGEEHPLEPSALELATDPSQHFMIVHDESGTPVYVPRNLPKTSIRKITGSKAHVAYSPFLALQIAQRVAEGETLASICRDPLMPRYGVLADWRRRHPEFKRLLLDARRDRAEWFIQKALDEVERSGVDRDEINLAKVRSEMYKYMSKVDDPDSYSERTTVKADVAVTGYRIETGIRRPGDPGFNKDEARRESRDVTPLEGGEDE